MTPATTWIRYKGDGSTPSDAAVQNRGETGRYLADPKLVTAVNTALAVEQPLLVTGEPGTGKTMLAWSIATELGLGPVLEFHTRSDNQARDTLYDFDYLLRFYHAQTRDARAENLESYIRWQALGEAIRSRDAARRADRRSRQGAARLPQRSARRARPDGVPGARARPDLQSVAPARGRRHQQQRTAAPRSVSPAVHFPPD